MATLLWGYATWDFYDGALLEALGGRLAREAMRLNPDQLSRVKKTGDRGISDKVYEYSMGTADYRGLCNTSMALIKEPAAGGANFCSGA